MNCQRRLYLNPYICDLLTICYDWTASCCSLCCNVLSAPCKLDEANLLRFSLLVLLCHHVDSWNEARVPPSTWIWLTLLCFSSFFCLLLTRQEAAMATALITLFVLEAIMPVVLLGLSAFVLCKQISLLEGMLVMVIVGISIGITAQWIRQTVYQRMGHG